MDILDLSVGEKRSRRKAQTPQRRSEVASQSNDVNNFDDVTTSKESIASDDEFTKSPDLRNELPDRPDSSPETRSPSPRTTGSFMSSSGSIDLDLKSANFQPNANSNNNIVENYHHAMLPKYPYRDMAALPFTTPADKTLFAETILSAQMKNFNARNEDVQPKDTPGIPERTKKQNRWAFNVWREWARKRNLTPESFCGQYKGVPLDVGKASEPELDYWLANFVQEIRRKDGNPYPPHTLMQIVMGIQRYLRQQAGRPTICILDRSNPAYSRFRSVLDKRIKDLTNSTASPMNKSTRRSQPSHATFPSHHSMIHYPDEDELWSNGVIGSDTAMSLLNAVFYHNTVTFGIRSVDDHWNLKISHFVIGNRGQQAQSYVEFVPTRDPVYVKRGMTQDQRKYADPSNPRCVVKLFMKYMANMPSAGAFYRHPQEPTLVDRSIKYSDQWIGKNRLRAMIKHIFDSTRLDGREKHHSVAPGPMSPPIHNNNQYLSEKAKVPSPSLAYSQLAQAVIHLSHLRSSQLQIQDQGSKPGSPNRTLSSDIRQSPAESQSDISETKSIKLEKRPYDFRNIASPKRSRSEEAADDVSVTSFDGQGLKENAMELSVPLSIETVTILRGNRKITVRLI